MLRAVTAHQFIKRMGTGKTKPCLLACTELLEAPLDDDVAPAEFELVVKFSHGCEAKIQGLIAEAFAAMLAADLGCPCLSPL